MTGMETPFYWGAVSGPVLLLMSICVAMWHGSTFKTPTGTRQALVLAGVLFANFTAGFGVCVLWMDATQVKPFVATHAVAGYFCLVLIAAIFRFGKSSA